MAGKTILIIEDNEELSGLISIFLERAGFITVRKSSGEDATNYLQTQGAALILLDIMLEGQLDGFSVCREIRETSSVPILFISALSEKEDKLKGFTLGADDYIEKPLDPDLLLAKVKAQLARSDRSQDESLRLLSGDVVIDRGAHQVFFKGEPLSLSAKEYELLLLLVLNEGKALSKDFLFNRIWGVDSFSESQTLTVHIKTLRDKIEEEPREPKRINTVWGVGYRYEEH